MSTSEKIEEAFKAGYHCRWHKELGEYYFDPAMSPGDPEGAYWAWMLKQRDGGRDDGRANRREDRD